MSDKRKTIDELSSLVKQLCDAMDEVFRWDSTDKYDVFKDLEARAKAKKIIKQAREAIYE